MLFVFCHKNLKTKKYFYCFLYYTYSRCVIEIHDYVPFLALMSFIFLRFASLCYVVLKLCELYMVFNHMLLILKSHYFDCKD